MKRSRSSLENPLKIKIPREIVSREIVSQTKAKRFKEQTKANRFKEEQDEKFIAYLKRMKDREDNLDDNVDQKINIVGPTSCVYFKKIDVEDGTQRNIVLFGDQHGSFETHNKCCSKETIRDIVDGKYKKMFKIIVEIKEYDLMLSKELK